MVVFICCFTFELYNQTMKITIFLLLTTIALLLGTPSAVGVPSWSLTSAVKTGTNSLFTTVKLAGTTHSFNINYPSGSFAGLTSPYLVYGIQRYRATDFLIQESFLMKLTYVDYMGFSIRLQITGITNPLLMSISFMAVDTANFPYYYNAFTEVPLNYATALTNFSVASTSLLTHTEVVNYADQNANFPSHFPVSTYTSFSAPYSKYRIALFLTGMVITATSTIPVSFDVTASVLSATSYSMSATLGYNATISALQFSQVFFDTSQFSLNLGKYLNFQEWSVTNMATTNFFTFNNALQYNFMMGLKSFSAVSGQCLLDYQWVLTTATDYGSQLQISTPYISGGCALSGSVSTILLMMKWSCPGGFPFFDLTSQTCLVGCNPYTYLNTTDSSCYPCQNTACYSCSANNSNICLGCATNFNIVNDTCICDTSTGSYQMINGVCYSCANLQANCAICAYSGNTSVAYNSASFVCVSCNATAGFFIDPINNCMPCSVSNCATCLGYSTCSVCNGGYGVTISGSCSTCPITGCQSCSNISVCATCMSGYTKISGLCYTCPSSCACGGYTLPKYPNGDCSTICGDGIIIFPYEGCDDGNTADGDGCSSQCQVQALSSCSAQPSVCYFTSTLSLMLIDTAVSPTVCNQITFRFSLSPSLLLANNAAIDWKTVIISQNASAMTLLSASYSNGVASLVYSFSRTLQNQSVAFSLNPLNMGASLYLQYTASSIWNFKVVPSNNVAAVYVDTKVCAGQSSITKLMQAEAGVAYFGLLLSVFSCKIVGLQMFGVLQLSYFVLGNYDYVPSALIGALQRSQVNGLNLNGGAKEESIPSRVSTNGVKASDFLANINIMLLITAVIAITGGVMYLATYIINKDKIDEENLSQALDNQNSAKNEPKQPQTRSQYWHRISKYLLKEVLLTFIIFNMFNISYSAGIQIQYINQVNSFSIICLLATFTLIIAVSIAQLVTGKEEFGEYIDKFRPERLQSKYMIATIVYRFTLGFLLATINEWAAGGIALTFVSAAFLSYICYAEPFTDVFQNRRSKFIHSVHILILFVNYYYRAEANNDAQESSQLQFPAYLQMSAVAVSVVGSTAILGYEFVKKYILKSNNGVQVPKESHERLKRKATNNHELTVEDFS